MSSTLATASRNSHPPLGQEVARGPKPKNPGPIADRLTETFDLAESRPFTARNGRQAHVISFDPRYGRRRQGGIAMGEGIVGGSSRSERCCAYAGCTTRLSVYNSDFLCWTHADVTTRARFERAAAWHAARSETDAPRSREPEHGSLPYRRSGQDAHRFQRSPSLGGSQ